MCNLFFLSNIENFCDANFKLLVYEMHANYTYLVQSCLKNSMQPWLFPYYPNTIKCYFLLNFKSSKIILLSVHKCQVPLLWTQPPDLQLLWWPWMHFLSKFDDKSTIKCWPVVIVPWCVPHHLCWSLLDISTKGWLYGIYPPWSLLTSSTNPPLGIVSLFTWSSPWCNL